MADPNTLGHFFENFTTSMFSVVIALIGFWTTFVKNLVNRKEVEEMISVNAQASEYAKDRQYIMERLQNNKEMQDQFYETLVKNTEVLNQLRVQLATLDKTLEHIQSKF
tara:strand:- start:285 stop:611 length:327 start_codon:yes stop_codon:yes gene_type:complete